MNSINLISAENTGGRIDVGQATGSTESLMFIYDLAPGQSSSPYHYEYDEEWLLVVDGTVVVRTPDGEHTVDGGELVRFPAGPEGAHKIMNRSDAPARTLLFSRRGLDTRFPSIQTATRSASGRAAKTISSSSAATRCRGPTAKRAGRKRPKPDRRPLPTRPLLCGRASATS